MKLMRLSDLKEHAKKSFNQTYATDGECFVDAFRYGEYHEERVDWHIVAKQLSRDALVDLWPAVCHWLIAGSAEHREGPTLALIIGVHEAIARWQCNQLEKPEDVLAPLAKVRELLTAELKADAKRWREVAIYFVMLESGIRQSMGVHLVHAMDATRELENLIRGD